MKISSTVRDTQRGSQNYMKNRRGMREIEMSRRRKRWTQEERDRSMQLSVPKVFSVAKTPTEIHRIGLRREGGREEIKVIWGGKKRVKKGREYSSHS